MFVLLPVCGYCFCRRNGICFYLCSSTRLLWKVLTGLNEIFPRFNLGMKSLGGGLCCLSASNLLVAYFVGMYCWCAQLLVVMIEYSVRDDAVYRYDLPGNWRCLSNVAFAG